MARKLTKAVAWTIVIAGYALMTIICGVAVVCIVADAWSHRSEVLLYLFPVLGIILGFLIVIALWVWAKDYTERI